MTVEQLNSKYENSPTKELEVQIIESSGEEDLTEFYAGGQTTEKNRRGFHSYKGSLTQQENTLNF